MYELSLIELESELAAALPARSLMSRRHGRRIGGTSANNGSVANGNSTGQTISNSQTTVGTGVSSAATQGNINGGGVPDSKIELPCGLTLNGALVIQAGLNSNSNTNTQSGTPVNLN
jgi:hypothetical protein